jgi:hypothetical protein
MDNFNDLDIWDCSSEFWEVYHELSEALLEIIFSLVIPRVKIPVIDGEFATIAKTCNVDCGTVLRKVEVTIEIKVEDIMGMLIEVKGHLFEKLVAALLTDEKMP